jgi:hypothetical protein
MGSVQFENSGSSYPNWNKLHGTNRKYMSFRVLTLPFWNLSLLAPRPQTEVAAPR